MPMGTPKLRWVPGARAVGCVFVKMETPRETFSELSRYTGSDAYTDVLGPWLDGSARWLREELAPLAVRGGWRREAYAFGDLLEQAYALSRVSDVLLLGFQPSLPADAERPWAHDLYLDREWPQITAPQYLAVFTALGMTQINVEGFDPFFHQIVAVDQSDDPDSPIEITDTVWPGLMLDELLFNRAGVRVRAGARYAEAGVADQSTLYEVFLRRYRHTSDGSLGWGHNSQWKTDFRRDYLTSTTYHPNIDADLDLSAGTFHSPAPLTAQQQRDLLRYRCLVRKSENQAAQDAWPGQWRLNI